MNQIDTLLCLKERISRTLANKTLSTEFLTKILAISFAEAEVWIEKFGDPLTSLAGAKVIAEHLGLDWHRAMSAAAIALDSKHGWLLPDVAPKAVVWMLNCLIDDAIASQRNSPHPQ
jgi:hypothetical protein